MTKALILAGGLGSRLHTYTQAQYPKLLLSLGNQTMLDKLVEYWFETEEVQEMMIVLSEESYVNMIQKYLNVFHSDKNIKLAYYPKTDGTFRTIYWILNQHPEYLTDVFLSWSDIVPHRKSKLADIENAMIQVYTDSNNVHRYGLDGNPIDGLTIKYSPGHEGNIMGLYKYKELEIKSIEDFYSLVINDDNEIDFVDYLMYAIEKYPTGSYDGWGRFISESIISIDDIGDIPKYEKYLESQSVEQRWFNDIVFTESIVYKKSISDYGKKVMQHESNFYCHAIKNSSESFPKILNADMNCIEMENLKTLEYKTIHEMPEDSKLTSDVFEAIEKLSESNIEKVKFNADIFEEYYRVPIERYSKIEYLIPKNITRVNGVLISDFYSMMDRLLVYLKSKTYSWGLIHGDPNSSNIMAKKIELQYTLDWQTNTSYYHKVKFIDPRGRFGNSNFYGDTNYDHAKFAYGLSGYSHFNLDKNFKFTIDGDEIKFDIEGQDLDEITDDIDVKILVGLIWLKLPYYIKNNPNKVIASYFYGMQLLTKYLK